MKNPNELIPNAENPEILTGISCSEPKRMAAGMPAVYQSAKHILAEMSIGRGLKSLNTLNQKGGIDCPGCAWPDPDDERSRLGEYCENGAKAIAEEATTKALFPSFFRENSVYDLSLLSDYEIGKKGRIAQPMYLPRGGSHYQEITWQSAFQKIGSKLNSLSSPNEAIFYTSGRTSNEAAFLYQLFVREYGTNNLPDCSNMCHESSGVALNESLGIGKGSVKLEDFYKTEFILIFGQNPGTNHPRMLSALKKAKKNGAIIVSINPLKEAGLLSFANPQELKGALNIKSKLTDIYLQVKINGDMALLKALLYRMIVEEKKHPNSVFDHEFIAQHTSNFTELISHIESLNFEELIAQSGLNKVQVEDVAQLLISKKKIIACWAMGLTQHKNAVGTIQDIVNILLLKGSIGKEGAGTCPVRGHSNVQGDRTMGIYEKPSPSFLDNLEKSFGFSPPRDHGYDTVEAIQAMYQKKAKFFFAMGGNFLSATPDTLYTAKAMRNCEMTVHVSTKLNRSHLIHGEEALILPCLGRTDLDILNGEAQFVSVENSMGVVHSSQGNLQPISTKLLSEAAIVCHMALATCNNKTIDWNKYSEHNDRIREDIERTIPGFTDYNKKIRIPEGFYLPNGTRENVFNTTNLKANFTISEYHPLIIESHELVMMTIRSHDQFNTTIYGLDDRYRGIYNERRVVLINKEDILSFGFQNGDLVDICNFTNGEERVARKFILVEYDIPKQCIATYFPETNVLVPITEVADKSGTPVSKSVVVELRKSI